MNLAASSTTSDPNTQIAEGNLCLPQFLRLPRSGSRDPIFGLTRSFWNNLILPCAANGGKPPIKSISLRKRWAARGVRLIAVDSAIAYFEAIKSEQLPPSYE